MVRKLKYHEQKLLRKVDFIDYGDNEHRHHDVIRLYHIQRPDDYHKYNRLCGELRKLAHRLSLLPPDSAVRQKLETALLDKVYDMGLVATKTKLSAIEHQVTVAAFARRRLPVVMTQLKMAESVKVAAGLVEQGQVRVGVDTVTDPAFLVTRNLEDFVTWSVGSKIKRNIKTYREEVDDFELV